MKATPLTHGVDTLVLWYSWGPRYRLPSDLHQRLEDALVKRNETDLDRPVFVDVSDLGIPATLEPRDFERAQIRRVRHYRYGLVFGDEALFLGISDPEKPAVKRDDYAQIRVELHGRYIRALGGNIREIVDAITARLIALMARAGLEDPDPVRIGVTRVDLYADFASPENPFELPDLYRFVSRARDRQAYLEDAAEAPGGERESAAPGAGGPPMSSTGAAKCTGEGLALLAAPSALAEAQVHLSGPRSTGAAKCTGEGLALLAAPSALAEAQVHLSGPRWTSFRFGSRKLLARIYSKTAEARKKPETKELLRDYAVSFGLDLENTVIWRVEFQLRKDVLTAFLHPEKGLLDLHDWPTLVENLGALWYYLTEHWLSLRKPTANQQKTRWPVDPLWTEVILAWAQVRLPLKRVRRPLRAAAEGLLAQAVGVILSAAAVQGVALERVAYARKYLERTLARLFRTSPRALPDSLAGGIFEHRYVERLALYQGVTA